MGSGSRTLTFATPDSAVTNYVWPFVANYRQAWVSRLNICGIRGRRTQLWQRRQPAQSSEEEKYEKDGEDTYASNDEPEGFMQRPERGQKKRRLNQAIGNH